MHDSSVGAGEQELERWEVGDFQAWIERAPRARLAAMIRGNPPRKLLERLSDALETIHAEPALRQMPLDAGVTAETVQTRGVAPEAAPAGASAESLRAAWVETGAAEARP